MSTDKIYFERVEVMGATDSMCKDVTTSPTPEGREIEIIEVENLEEVVLWTSDSADDRILSISSSYETIWERSIKLLIDDPFDWINSVHQDDRARVECQYRSRSSSRSLFAEYRLQQPDGAERWIRDRTYPYLDASLGRACVLRISERIMAPDKEIVSSKALEEEVRRLQKFESLGVLARGLAHDVNNLLGCILFDIDLVRQDLDSQSPGHEFLREAMLAVERSEDLTKRILKLFRPEDNQPGPVQLVPIIHEILALIKGPLTSRIDTIAEIEDGLPPTYGSSAELYQVILNLCVNACQAMQDRGGRLRIGLEHGRREDFLFHMQDTNLTGPYLRLTVSDSGPGIDPANLSRVFDPFFTTKQNGSGLGLSVVQRIVLSLGGDVTVSSTPGEGATFVVYLPSFTEMSSNSDGERSS